MRVINERSSNLDLALKLASLVNSTLAGERERERREREGERDSNLDFSRGTDLVLPETHEDIY